SIRALGSWFRCAFALSLSKTTAAAFASWTTIPIAIATAATKAAAATTAVAFATTPFVERTSPAATVAIARVIVTAFGCVFAAFSRFEQCAMRQIDAAHAIDLGHQDLQLVADVDHILDGRYAVVGQLGDVHQP